MVSVVRIGSLCDCISTLTSNCIKITPEWKGQTLPGPVMVDISLPCPDDL